MRKFESELDAQHRQLAIVYNIILVRSKNVRWTRMLSRTISSVFDITITWGFGSLQNTENGGNLLLSLGTKSKKKVFSSGGGQSPGPRWGLRPRPRSPCVSTPHFCDLATPLQSVVGPSCPHNLCFSRFQYCCPLSMELTPFWYLRLFFIK